ncbi:MAG TPA: hypothetical protein PK205_07290, partial [Promineifilum sp.]|nr:hypothetical protein [Promineifilum sp.]
MADRILPTSASGVVPGPDYLDAVAEKVGILFNSIALRPVSISNVGSDYTIVIDPVLIADVEVPMSFYVQPNVDNTGAVRMRVSASNPYYPIVKGNGADFEAGEFKSDTLYFCVFLGGEFRVAASASDGGGEGINYYRRQVFDVSGTWNKPAGLPGTATVQVELWGGGGGGSNAGANGNRRGGGGGGSYNLFRVPAVDLTSSVSITVAAGGAAGSAGGVSSFGAYANAYGGGAGGYNTVNNTGGGGGGGGGGISSVGSSGGVSSGTTPAAGGTGGIDVSGSTGIPGGSAAGYGGGGGGGGGGGNLMGGGAGDPGTTSTGLNGGRGGHG